MTTIIGRARTWFPLVAILLAVAATVPPVGTDARRYAAVQAVQFVLFAVVVPALLALGWPTRSRRMRPPGSAELTRLAGQPTLRAAVTLLPFVALAIAWRLPAALRALDRDPALSAAELVTLTASGTLLWLELTAVFAGRQPLPRPLRAGMAAVAMWSIWAVAYATGMSGGGILTAQTGSPGAVAESQVAVAVLWAVPGICFVPVVYATLMSWLGDRDSADAAMAASVQHGHARSAVVTSPRAPRGWRR